MRLFSRFLDALNDVMNNIPADIECFNLLPPIDANLGTFHKLSLLQKLSVALASFLSSNFPKLPTKLMLMKYKPPTFVKKNGLERERNPKALKRTCFIPLELPEEQTSLLLKSCKEHKVTVHGVFQAATCIAYSELSQGGTLSSPTRWCVEQPST